MAYPQGGPENQRCHRYGLRIGFPDLSGFVVMVDNRDPGLSEDPGAPGGGPENWQPKFRNQPSLFLVLLFVAVPQKILILTFIPISVFRKIKLGESPRLFPPMQPFSRHSASGWTPAPGWEGFPRKDLSGVPSLGWGVPLSPPSNHRITPPPPVWDFERGRQGGGRASASGPLSPAEDSIRKSSVVGKKGPGRDLATVDALATLTPWPFEQQRERGAAGFKENPKPGDGWHQTGVLRVRALFALHRKAGGYEFGLGQCVVLGAGHSLAGISPVSWPGRLAKGVGAAGLCDMQRTQEGGVSPVSFFFARSIGCFQKVEGGGPVQQPAGGQPSVYFPAPGPCLPSSRVHPPPAGGCRRLHSSPNPPSSFSTDLGHVSGFGGRSVGQIFLIGGRGGENGGSGSHPSTPPRPKS